MNCWLFSYQTHASNSDVCRSANVLCIYAHQQTCILITHNEAWIWDLLSQCFVTHFGLVFSDMFLSCYGTCWRREFETGFRWIWKFDTSIYKVSQCYWLNELWLMVVLQISKFYHRAMIIVDYFLEHYVLNHKEIMRLSGCHLAFGVKGTIFLLENLYSK